MCVCGIHFGDISGTHTTIVSTPSSSQPEFVVAHARDYALVAGIRVLDWDLGACPYTFLCVGGCCCCCCCCKVVCVPPPLTRTIIGKGFVQLRPPELVVLEGGVAIFTCSPLYSVAIPILVRDGAAVIHKHHPRITFSDHGLDTMDGFRTYQLANVTRRENGTKFTCAMGGFFSNTITMTVFGKRSNFSLHIVCHSDYLLIMND